MKPLNSFHRLGSFINVLSSQTLWSWQISVKKRLGWHWRTSLMLSPWTKFWNRWVKQVTLKWLWLRLCPSLPYLAVFCQSAGPHYASNRATGRTNVPVWKFMVSENTAPPIFPIGSVQVLSITVHFLCTWQLLVSSTTKLYIGPGWGERWRLGGNIETLKRELKEWILFMSEIVDRNVSLLSGQNEAFKWVGSGSDSI